jgi:hypothetical protein
MNENVDVVINEEEVVEEVEESSNHVPDFFTRMQWYSFIRKRTKPNYSSKKISLPKQKKDESVTDYFQRCYDETGVRPSPIGPMKLPQPNKACPCGAKDENGKVIKFKKCCMRKVW